MNSMTKLVALSTISLACVVAACGDDEETTTGTQTGATTGGGGTGGTSTGTDGGGGAGAQGGGGGGNPPVPTLGTQIDRMGRPAVATATYERFVDGDTHDAAVDTWNQDDAQGTWAGSYTANIAGQLAVLDALDGACENQLIYANPLATPPPTCPAAGNEDCYGLFATVLSNDWITIKLSGADAPLYLGVEADFTGLLANDTRGGRLPEHDVIDVSYSLLSGAFDPNDAAIFLFGDGVDAPAQAQVELFPYLAAPN